MAGRPCTVCEHRQLEAINRALVDLSGNPNRFRLLSTKYGLGPKSLERHLKGHMTPGLQKAVAKHAELVEETTQLDVLARLGRLVVKAETMLDAADAWLRDPEDPSRYTLGPREHEVFVIWERLVEGPRGGLVTERKRERLSEILKRCAEKSPTAPSLDEVTVVETKFADPRKLLLESVSTLKPVLELLGKAYGQIKADPVASLNVFLAGPSWASVEAALATALAPHPAAAEDVGRALARLAEGRDG